MYNNIMNRDLFQRYARQPRPQAPAAPSGIMASSPELMQTAMRYQQGGMVQPPVAQPRVNPQFRPDLMRFQDGGGVQTYSDPFLNPEMPKQVDITQTPTEFKETVTEVSTPGTRKNARGQTVRGTVSESSPPTSVGNVNARGQPVRGTIDPLEEAEAAGEAVINGDVTPENVPPELQPTLDTVQNPDASNPEKAAAILEAAGVEVPKGTKGKIAAMKKLISETYGVDPARYDNLRALNRATVGFAIAEGGDIASALKQGAAGAARIEEAQLAREDSMSEMALQQAFAEKLAGMRNNAALAGKASDYTPERLRQRAIEAILRSPDQFNVYDEKTGAVDPAKVQREADILVSAMSNSSSQPPVDIAAPTATGPNSTNDLPTTPGVRFKDKTTGKIMVVGQDGVAVEE
jgi:hypothetical protein